MLYSAVPNTSSAVLKSYQLSCIKYMIRTTASGLDNFISHHSSPITVCTMCALCEIELASNSSRYGMVLYVFVVPKTDWLCAMRAQALFGLPGKFLPSPTRPMTCSFEVSSRPGWTGHYLTRHSAKREVGLVANGPDSHSPPLQMRSYTLSSVVEISFVDMVGFYKSFPTADNGDTSPTTDSEKTSTSPNNSLQWEALPDIKLPALAPTLR